MIVPSTASTDTEPVTITDAGRSSAAAKSRGAMLPNSALGEPLPYPEA